jgi:hypothetical protein
MKVTTVPGFSEAFAGRDRGDTARSEIGPEQAGIDEPEMWRDDQPVELLVGRIGKCENRPVATGAFVIGFDLDAAHNAVGTGGRGDLKILALVLVDLDRAGKIESDVVAGDLDRFDGKSCRRRAQCRDCREDKCKNAPIPEMIRQYQSFALAPCRSSEISA